MLFLTIRISYCEVNSRYTLTIQHLVLYIRNELLKYTFLYKRNVTIFPFNFSALYHAKLLINPVLKHVEQEQLASENLAYLIYTTVLQNGR